MELWDEKSTRKGKIWSFIFALAFAIPFFYVLLTPFDYSHVCKEKFYFNESRTSYNINEIFRSTLCPYDPHDDWLTMGIDEGKARKWMMSFILFIFKLNFLIALAYLVMFCFESEFRKDIIEKLKDYALWCFVMWNWVIGLFILISFILGWF